MTEQTQHQAQEPAPGTAPPPGPPPPAAPPPAVPPPAGPPRDRKALRTAVRWTAAVAVLALVATGTAFGITRMDRTDLPGLATASDGRWPYPELVRPPLPAGSPGPFDARNKTGAHHADLRALLLPAPEGARLDPPPHGTDGWLPTKDFLVLFQGEENRRELGQKLTDHGLRHIAARGWTTPDGTHTSIQLLQFDTAVVSEGLMVGNLVNSQAPTYSVRGADSYALDETFPSRAHVKDVTLYPYTETEPYGAEQVRQAYLVAGDTIAVITQSRRGTADAVPFRQTVTLQTELLT
ncbi:hypothetical protein ACPCA8_21125 [Streptomyces capoamus]|uniref:hypothetical protein n=1 Tax=Streptomyces capoamus TaxID=68183 RepID=UPI003C2E8C9C